MTTNQPASQPASQPEQQVGPLIGIGLLTRLVIDTGVQIFYPFLPIIAGGMGITTITLGRLIGLRGIMGLFSPLFGTLADRRGYRRVMQIALLLGGLGFVIIGVSRNLWMTTVGVMTFGLGAYAFTPTLQAYLSSRLPYSRRARGLGILEYAWALAGIVGLFLAGILIEATSWRTPFVLFGVLLLVAVFVYGRLPARPQTEQLIGKTTPLLSPKQDEAPFMVRVRRFLDMGENARSVWSVIFTSAFLMFGAFNFFISYGSWLVEDFGLGAAALGRVALVLGISDLVGSVSVSLFSDGIGKRRSVLIGALASGIGFFVLPFFNVGLITAVIGIFIARSFFEFAVVSNMTVLSEQVKEQRGKVLTIGSAVALTGSSVVGFTGPWAFDTFGVWGLGILSGCAMLVAFFLTLSFTVEPE